MASRCVRPRVKTGALEFRRVPGIAGAARLRAASDDSKGRSGYAKPDESLA